MKGTEEKIYQNEGNPAVLDAVPGCSGLALDVGCGDGANFRALVAKGLVVDGITLSTLEAAHVAPHVRKVFVCNLEDGMPEVTDKYNVIICSHVLEHIAYPKKLLEGIRGVMAPGAIMVVALPNVMNYRSRLELIKGNFPVADSGVWDYTHVRWYTIESASELFKNHGFEIDRVWVDGALPLYRITRHIPRSIQNACFRVLVSISKGLFGSQILYRLRLA